MAKYKVLKTYFSGSQNRQLTEGEVLELNEEKSKILDESISLFAPGYLEKLEEKKRGPKTKEKDGE